MGRRRRKTNKKFDYGFFGISGCLLCDSNNLFCLCIMVITTSIQRYKKAALSSETDHVAVQTEVTFQKKSDLYLIQKDMKRLDCHGCQSHCHESDLGHIDSGHLGLFCECSLRLCPKSLPTQYKVHYMKCLPFYSSLRMYRRKC